MNIAGIVAGGSGSRMGGNLPKQFFDLGGKPVIVHTIEHFLQSPQIDAVFIGVNSQWEDYMNQLKDKFFFNRKNIIVVQGGDDRNQTIMNLISAAKKQFDITDRDIILTHDAVRPFVTEKMIADSIEAMKDYQICTVAVPATDTIMVSNDGKTADTFPDRKTMYCVQTPQTFYIQQFESVYMALSDEEKAVATDVCGLYQRNGCNVGIVAGDVSNIKLTYPHDYKVAKLMMDTTSSL